MPWQMEITLDPVGAVSLKVSAPPVRPSSCTQLYTPRETCKEVLQDCTEGYAVDACSGAAYPAVADMMPASRNVQIQRVASSG